MVRVIRLKEYLQQVNVAVAKSPPMVHSTSAHRLIDIIGSGKLLAMPCNVFAGDKLCYCFLGRPAYKGPSVESPSEWQLPIAFVLRFHQPPPIKRVFPFDSGAFLAAGRLPSYITCFKLDGYDISGDPNNIGRLISFFFKSTERYVSRRAAGYEELKEEHNLDMSHQEVLAIARLFQEHSSARCDDRSAAIEMQIEADITLAKDNLLGVVIPEEFKRTPGLMQALKSIAGHVQTYPHYPLGTQEHYALIYDGVKSIYKKAGIVL
jgi:hypothetical protein